MRPAYVPNGLKPHTPPTSNAQCLSWNLLFLIGTFCEPIFGIQNGVLTHDGSRNFRPCGRLWEKRECVGAHGVERHGKPAFPFCSFYNILFRDVWGFDHLQNLHLRWSVGELPSLTNSGGSRGGRRHGDLRYAVVLTLHFFTYIFCLAEENKPHWLPSRFNNHKNTGKQKRISLWCWTGAYF